MNKQILSKTFLIFLVLSFVLSNSAMLVPLRVRALPPPIFYSSFEPATFGDWTSHDNDWINNAGNAQCDNKKALIKLTNDPTIGDIIKEISTIGYTNINLKFYYKIRRPLESNDFVKVKWFDGSNWHLIHTFSGPVNDWTLFEDSLPPGAENLPDFQLKFIGNFKKDGNQDKDVFWLDCVELTGEEIPPSNDGVLQGRKYQDTNENGAHDSTTTEPRLSGWTINLYDSEWEFLESQDTKGDPIGQYKFEDLPDGTYYLCEEMKDGWQQTGPKEGTNPVDLNGIDLGLNAVAVENESSNSDIEGPICWQAENNGNELIGWLKFGNIENPPVTIVASKVICDEEQYLPNWGAVKSDGNPITETTAQDWVDQYDPHCWLDEGWEFEWAYDGISNPGDSFYGQKGSPWYLFDVNSPAQIIDLQQSSKIWVREVLQNDYIPFTHESTPDNSDNYSAELYCYTDVLNYDNYDYIDNPVPGNTYYCVGFNTPQRYECNREIWQCELNREGQYSSYDDCSDDCHEPELVCVPGINLLKNGSFEFPEVTNSSKWQLFPSGTALLEWIVGWVSTAPSMPPEIEIQEGVLIAASDGDQSVELDSVAPTYIFQEVGTLPGYEYTLTFDFATRPNTPEEDNRLEVLINDVSVKTVSSDSSLWQEKTHNFVATTNLTEIKFVDVGIDNSLGTFLDNVSLECVGLEQQPYCGDGMKNQEWEQCDGECGCTQMCLWTEQEECNDLVLARVNVDEVSNFDGDGDMSSNIYLGSNSYIIPAGIWFPLYWNGSYFTDPDIAAYEDVPGLPVQRLEGNVRAVLHGSWSNNSKEHIHGNIEFYNANVLAQRNDEFENNTLEKGFDDTGVGNYNASNDEVWIEDGDTNHSYFWLTTTTADDGFYTDWQVIEDCKGGNICGIKFFDANQNGEYDDGDYNIADWMISLWSKIECIDGEEWADKVISFDQGLKNNGDPVDAERSNPAKALDEAERDDTVNFVSLGFGGELVLKFNNFIENRPGDDIEVVETSYGSPACSAYPETVRVYASQDGIDWEDLGDACLDGTFDLDLGSLGWAQYVKLVDESDSSKFNGNTDGYDIDGVRAINCLAIDEENKLTTSTTENGYCFENLESKSYYICEETRDLWFNTTPICYQILIEDNNYSIDFGNYTEEPEPENSTVTICKYDDQENSLGEWQVALVSTESVDGPTAINVSDNNGTDSVTLPAGYYLIKASGTYKYGSSAMIADAGYSYRPAGIPDGCDCWVSGFDLSSGSDGLMAWIDGNPVYWGPYNDNHVYTTIYYHGGGTINTSIYDNVYGDNLNDNNFSFEIFPIKFEGTTGENGCVIFNDVPYGEYEVDEYLKSGWQNYSGLENVVVDDPTEEFDIVNIPPEEQIGSLTICKYRDYEPFSVYEEDIDIPLAWEIRVIDPSQSSNNYQTDPGTGCVIIPNLIYGQYEISEIQRVDWDQTYPLDPNTYTIQIDGGNSNPLVYFLNYKIINNGGIKYACDPEGQCVENEGGSYTTSNCNDECQPYPYSCNSSTLQCVRDAHGKFGSLQGCQDACGASAGPGGQYLGLVLGAATEKEEEACGLYLLEYIKYGGDNNPQEVKKLQYFLNEYLGIDLEITGIYNQATYQAVMRFQLLLNDEILAPWVEVDCLPSSNIATGYVYRTTQWKINMIVCPELNLPVPNLYDETCKYIGLYPGGGIVAGAATSTLDGTNGTTTTTSTTTPETIGDTTTTVPQDNGNGESQNWIWFLIGFLVIGGAAYLVYQTRQV